MSRSFDLSQRGYHSRNKNALFNGAFEVWQRGTSFAGPTSGSYQTDRFRYINVGSAVHTISRSTDVPTVAEAGLLAPYSVLIDCTTSASPGASDQVRFEQVIEGYTWRHYAQRALTLTFWVKATKTGTYCVFLFNSGTDRYLVQEYTVSVADTWEKKQVQLPASPSAGTWDYTDGTGVVLGWTLMVGSTLDDATAGAWAAGIEIATANQVNACDNTANNFHLALVQLEVGDESTAFEPVPFAEELLRCQRYYEKSFAYATAPSQNVGVNTGGHDFPATVATTGVQQAPYITFATTKRIAPTITTFNPANTNAQVRDRTVGGDCSSTVTFNNSQRGFSLQATGNASTAVGNLLEIHYTAEAEL